MVRTLWWIGCAGAMVACEAAPNRPLLDDFPTAADDTDADPVVNGCLTRTHAFAATSVGYVENALEGIASFDWVGDSSDRSTILLQACKRGLQPQTLALNWYGGGPLRKGSFEVSREAGTKSGFEFIFVDDSEERPVTCSDSPTGSVTIERANGKVVKGSFTVDVRCYDDVVLDDDQLPNRPALTTFTGTFSAGDVRGY